MAKEIVIGWFDYTKIKDTRLEYSKEDNIK